jgi:hypothetical protein
MSVAREVVVESGDGLLQGMRVSWGGIISGVLVVLGILILLTALGIAVGITATDPAETEAADVGRGAAIWSALSLLIALFLGGLGSTRLGMVWDRTTGIVQGGLVWVLAMLVILMLAASGVSMIVGGALNMAGSAAGSAAEMAQSSGGMRDLATGSPDEMIQRLRDPQTAGTIASLTGQSESEVQLRLQAIAANVEAARDNPEQAAAEVRAGVAEFGDLAKQRATAVAEEAKPEATAGAWISFLALLLSLAAAVLGAAVGRRKAAERITDPLRTADDLTPGEHGDLDRERSRGRRVNPERV